MWVLPEETMLMVTFVSEEVANVCERVARPFIEVMPVSVKERHVPLMAKQPPVKLMDAVPVVVAPESFSCPETLRYVLVACVEEERVKVPSVAKRLVAVAFPISTVPSVEEAELKS